jgi:hypothetical protein
MAAKMPKEGGASGSKPPVDLQEMLKKLVLKDEELDDVVLPKEDVVNLKEGARWMAVVRVHTTRHFGNQPFFQKMDVAWGFAKSWTIRPVEDNLFILQVSCLGDWNRVMNDGPWIFRQMGVMVEPYDGVADPASVVLNRLHAWVQVRGIPPLFRKDDIVRDMAARIGEVLGASGTSFVRVRVKLDVHKALTRVVGLHPEGSERLMFQVLYEKLPKFCDVCGLLGHGVEECEDGVHEQSALQYGEWMIAPMEDWHPNSSGVRMREPPRENFRGGRGGGRGYGAADSRKRPPGATPPRAGKGEAATPGAEGRLMLNDGQGDPSARKNLDIVLAAEKEGAKVGDASPVKPDTKRPRMSGSNSDEAGSVEGHRQEQ